VIAVEIETAGVDAVVRPLEAKENGACEDETAVTSATVREIRIAIGHFIL
jgi:hypothetical protein